MANDKNAGGNTATASPPEGKHLQSIVGDKVMLALGRPKDLLHVSVRCLWKQHFRVNVVVGPDMGACRIAHSYFVVTDDRGELTQATPKLVKRYDSKLEPS